MKLNVDRYLKLTKSWGLIIILLVLFIFGAVATALWISLPKGSATSYVIDSHQLFNLDRSLRGSQPSTSLNSNTAHLQTLQAQLSTLKMHNALRFTQAQKHPPVDERAENGSHINLDDRALFNTRIEAKVAHWEAQFLSRNNAL